MGREEDKIIEALSGIHISEECINMINSDVILNILKLAIHKSYKKGDVIVSVDDACINIGFLLSGAIRSYYIDSNGNDLTKFFYLENHFFLDEVLYGYENSICYYEALEDCEVIFINAKLLKDIITSNDALIKLYIQCLEKGLRYKVEREHSFLMKSASERYLDFRREYPSLETRVRQSYIATYLGIKPESLSRIRKGFRQ